MIGKQDEGVAGGGSQEGRWSPSILEDDGIPAASFVESVQRPATRTPLRLRPLTTPCPPTLPLIRTFSSALPALRTRHGSIVLWMRSVELHHSSPTRSARRTPLALARLNRSRTPCAEDPPSLPAAGSSRRNNASEPLLLESEREAVADLLQYLESECCEPPVPR